jgi:low molecular weight protein-tyrosine phosphatase
MRPRPLAVAVICSGNRFRSPLAAGLLAHRAPRGALRVVSRGTLETDGEEALPEAVALARRLDLDLSRHSAAQLEPGDLRPADLVLGFEPKHLERAVDPGGALAERTFALTELVELLRDETVAAAPDARERLRRAAELRRHRPEASYSTVEDPYGQPYPVHAEVASRIDALVTELVRRLWPAPPGE